MENKINIAEILRDMPEGTKLYSPLFGECNLDEVSTSDRKTYTIILLTSADILVYFTKTDIISKVLKTRSVRSFLLQKCVVGTSSSSVVT